MKGKEAAIIKIKSKRQQTNWRFYDNVKQTYCNMRL